MEKHDIRVTLPKKLYDQIEEDVVKLHIELGLSIPVKANKVAKRLGFIVRKFSEIYSEENRLLELRIIMSI